MITVDTIARVRRAYFVQKKPIKAISRDLRLARNTVRSIVRRRKRQSAGTSGASSRCRDWGRSLLRWMRCLPPTRGVRSGSA